MHFTNEIFFWLLIFRRLQTIYRLAHGGRSYKIDIYLRNWSIRTELKRRAYLYNIENDSFPQPDPEVPVDRRPRNDGNNSSSLLVKTTTTVDPLNFTSGLHQDVETYENSSNTKHNDRDHERRTNQPNLSYQKQYCDKIKTIQTDLIHTNGVNIAALTEINKTARKQLRSNLDVKILCGKHGMIVDRCGTWSKNIRNCSEKKGASSASNEPTQIAETVKKPSKLSCPFNPLTKCDNGKANKAPNLKTQNTFISRLFLTDVFDNI